LDINLGTRDALSRGLLTRAENINHRTGDCEVSEYEIISTHPRFLYEEDNSTNGSPPRLVHTYQPVSTGNIILLRLEIF